MERVLEDEIFSMNKMRREDSGIRSCKINSVEGVSQGNKYKQRTGKEASKEKGTSNIGKSERNWEGVPRTKAMVPYKKINRGGIGGGNRKIKAQHDLFKQIQYKLQSLEEDIQHLKKILLQHVEERDVLISKVVQQFHMITERLGSLNPDGISLMDHSLAIHHKLGSKNIGLAEVLHQELTPPVVTRDMKVNLNTFQVLA
ncbi:uncharacterized protein [Elaeis guineensis]|uniref:Uncharacterized protein LOC105039063 n=1 Tax=Elaeis guineensis var. tenera TaxID=51953 RepID=A0A6I9QQR5_ELAGV|nr:uncharacterized protein LOC105039063 [Elaeis guineensis]